MCVSDGVISLQAVAMVTTVAIVSVSVIVDGTQLNTTWRVLTHFTLDSSIKSRNKNLIESSI